MISSRRSRKSSSPAWTTTAPERRVAPPALEIQSQNVMSRIHETAFAKINLDLRVCHRRADGYHELDSLVVFADAGDHLTFEPADGCHLTIEGPFEHALPNGDDNLVIRAAKALADLTNRPPNVRITLDKHLPIASGIGGGSADAAAALRGLTRLWDLPLSLADLVPLAQSLGADVPVCLGSTATRMQGIGDRLTEVTLPSDLPMILVNPGKAVSTPDVFRALGVFSGSRSTASFNRTSGDFRAHLADSVNDLETPAVQVEPEIDTVLRTLRDQSETMLVRMSGSGATCFALFDDDGARDRAAAAISADNPGWWVWATSIKR